MISSYRRRKGLLHGTAWLLTMLIAMTLSIHLQAFAEDGELTCGLTQHQHESDCYGPVLVCDQEEREAIVKTVRIFTGAFSVHVHTDSCLNAEGKIQCGYIAGEYLHQHNEWCFDEDGNLVCGLEERATHRHNSECTVEVRELVCNLEETAGHQHSEECWKLNRMLICSLPETSAHQHSEECYTVSRQLICTLEEDKGHAHTDSCFDDEGNLICTQMERNGHQHGEACYSEEKTLTCTRPETEGHTHTEACWLEESELICSSEEVEPHAHTEECWRVTTVHLCNHRHTSACFETVIINGEKRTLAVCGYLEVLRFTSGESDWEEQTVVIDEGHVHSDACWDVSEKPVCGYPEHEHFDECQATYELLEEKQTANEFAEEIHEVLTIDLSTSFSKDPEENAIGYPSEESTEETTNDLYEEIAEETETDSLEPEKMPQVIIRSSVAGVARVGDEITLSVTIPEGYAIQWQFTPDAGKTVLDIEGAILSDYSFVLTSENMDYRYRVCVYQIEPEEISGDV